MGVIWFETHLTQRIHDHIDARCDNDVPGCERVINGEGVCAEWAGPSDTYPAVTIQEMKCSRRMHELFSPDIDADWDGEPELISAGYKIQAIPVTIDN